MWLKYKNPFLIVVSLLFLASLASLPNLVFKFDFEQFFPEGDEDLEFYKEFIADFETDNNFLLIGIENKEGVFDSIFLSKINNITREVREVPEVKTSQSITSIRMPLKTPFGYTSLPFIHIDEPSRYNEDKAKILADPRIMGNLINAKANAIAIVLKTTDTLELEKSDPFISSISKVVESNGITDFHLLGRTYFQSEIVKVQKNEILICGCISFALVIFIIWLIFRKITIIYITVSSVVISLVIFFGFMSVTGRELTIMSALYPVIILIAGTSDIIHILSKYLFELRHGAHKNEAVNNTIKEVGMSTLITSLTTAIGFVALMTSRIGPVKDFGLNCAIGVMLTFLVAVPLTLSLLYFFDEHSISQDKRSTKFWDDFLAKLYLITKNKQKSIFIGFGVFLVFCAIGISMITTNYNIKKNLPLYSKIGRDFMFFEDQFSGFRPFEFAVLPQGDYKAGDYEVVKSIDSLENYLLQFGKIGSIVSQAALYKTVAKANNENAPDAYKFPQSEEEFDQYQPLVSQIMKGEAAILVNPDQTKTRITSKITDVGADSIKLISKQIDAWIKTHLDPNIVQIRQTGTGLILDKNSKYVKQNLIYGLGLSLLLISLIMALIIKSWRMAIVAFIPNFVPILFAAGLLGWLDIELEAGISIVFGVVFGIVVDDTIHFLGRYKVGLDSGLSIEQALETTFNEAGRALIFTTIILFSAFLVMMFSSQPLTKIVGLLISVTFISGLFCDILLIPVLIRLLYPEIRKK